MTDRPAYDALPTFSDALPVRHARAYWGPRNRLGTLTVLTPAAKLRALAVPRTGRCVNLSLPISEPDPPLFERAPLRHRHFDRDRNIAEDVLENFDLQGSSQWDGLGHIRARQHGVFNAEHLDSEADVGIHQWVRHGVVARGVLLDLPRYWAGQGRDVDPFACARFYVADLTGAADAQGVELRDGDLLLIRTGWLAAYRADPGRELGSIGLASTEETARFLWDGGFCALATDNPAVEAVPADPGGGFLHRLLIPALGMPLGELWDFEELAEVAAETGGYDCCVVSVPLNVPGAAGSPANAMAIV